LYELASRKNCTLQCGQSRKFDHKQKTKTVEPFLCEIVATLQLWDEKDLNNNASFLENIPIATKNDVRQQLAVEMFCIHISLIHLVFLAKMTKLG
jgi:hypothetical protein